jgi:cytochrome c
MRYAKKNSCLFHCLPASRGKEISQDVIDGKQSRVWQQAQNRDNEKAKSGNDIKAFLNLGSIDHGKTVATKCIGCHSVSKGGGNKIGPALWGVIGRKVGSISGYKYSKAMSRFGKNWDFEAMNNFLIKPKDYVKGNKMAFAGISKEKDRASLILYLNEQNGSPLPLP